MHNLARPERFSNQCYHNQAVSLERPTWKISRFKRALQTTLAVSLKPTCPSVQLSRVSQRISETQSLSTWQMSADVPLRHSASSLPSPAYSLTHLRYLARIRLSSCTRRHTHLEAVHIEVQSQSSLLLEVVQLCIELVSHSKEAADTRSWQIYCIKRRIHSHKLTS